MKRASFYLLLFVFSASVIFTIHGCGKDDEPAQEKNDTADDDDEPTDPEVPDSLTIFLDDTPSNESSQISFNSQKDAILLIIQSNNSWEISSDEGWLALAAKSGDAGGMGVIVGASENEGIPRKGQLTITSGDKTHLIEINQEGAPSITFTVNEISFHMVRVNGGDFSMGTDELLGEGPEHNVTLSDYYICDTEVTNELWLSVTGSLPYSNYEYFDTREDFDLPQKPVSAVSWNDVTGNFMPEINSFSGVQFSLPTEAQWEYAAMGGSFSEGYDFAGSNDLDEVAWHEGNSNDKKHEVAQKSPNELGLYDMSGNVSEWCSDWYGDYDWQSEEPDPTGPETGTTKVTRGGDYNTPLFSVKCHVKARNYQVPDCYNGCWGDTGDPDEPVCFQCQSVGFRLVLEVN